MDFVIKVVFSTDGKFYRTVLTPAQYTTDRFGVIILPNGYHTAGYWQRMTGNVWDDLEWLPAL